MIGYFIARGPGVDNGIPFLVDESPQQYSLEIVLLAFAAGFGLSAMRQRRRHGRLGGAVVFLLSVVCLLGWLDFLLNWQSRPWG